METERANGAEGVARRLVSHAADFQFGERLHRRQKAFRYHARQVHRVAQAVALEDSPRAPAGTGFEPVVANPVGPLQAAGIEMDRWERYAPGQIHLAGHRRREESRIEHLEGDARRGDAHAAQLADLAGCPAGRDGPEGLAQVGRYVLKVHSCQYRAP